jgi:uncharacterized membrane protein
MSKSIFGLDAISLVRYLFIFIALVMFLFGLGTLLRVNQNPDHRVLYLVYAVLMFVDAAPMLACGLFIAGRKQVYWFAVGFLALNIILIITDQFGIPDFLYLSINAITLGLLTSARKKFLDS